LKLADQVVVLEGGRIVEAGTPDQLIRATGHLQKMMQVYTGGVG